MSDTRKELKKLIGLTLARWAARQEMGQVQPTLAETLFDVIDSATVLDANPPEARGLRAVVTEWIKDSGRYDVSETPEKVAENFMNFAALGGGPAVPDAPAAPKYPVEIRCAEIEEALREILEAVKRLPANDGRVIGLIPIITRADAALRGDPTPPAQSPGERNKT